MLNEFFGKYKIFVNYGPKSSSLPSTLCGGAPLKDKPSPKIPKKLEKIYHKIPWKIYHVISRQAQNTQNSMCKSLQYLKKEGRDEIDFLHGDKHQTFLLVDAINLGGHGQTYPNYPK